MSKPDIHPEHIDTGKEHWWDSFGRCEREVSAKLFVRACQKVGAWMVTEDQLDARRLHWGLSVQSAC